MKGNKEHEKYSYDFRRCSNISSVLFGTQLTENATEDVCAQL